ncbi:epoxide hydrolase family protein [Rhabdothermincola salaria]|uniref:epoxide hydrolase family protein n=1 Tax=Rhabdothermincola salaria TaxID=2903142 RepID=UPI001E446AA0|nr:epoxide hydrolase [Rhabdothermincola salaria]MCD9624517.1 epoxide hydrolase 1 [Rhabdothermincola salaria]
MQAFTVAVPDPVLDDLRARLARTRLPNQVEGVGWEQGTEREYLGSLLEHWQSRYDWRATEARLNAFPQLVTEVEGQRVHLVHTRSSNPEAVPLLLTHGWPGSVMEFLDVLDPLTEDFHVVAPSLPGFTFSGPTTRRGWHPRRIAAAFAQIMERLGYPRYGLQGGDWGSMVSANLADLHPERVVGLHLTMVAGVPVLRDVELTAEEQAMKQRVREWRRTGQGYQEIQGTRPQSLGYGLEDSPAALAAWIVEKFREWSDADLEGAFTMDRLLDNITAYWVTATATSSLRIYWEARQAGPGASPQRRIEVPTAVAQFPGEISYPPRAWVDAAYEVVRWSHPARGGHFAAMEAPAVFVDDVRAFFAELG